MDDQHPRFMYPETRAALLTILQTARTPVELSGKAPFRMEDFSGHYRRVTSGHPDDQRPLPADDLEIVYYLDPAYWDVQTMEDYAKTAIQEGLPPNRRVESQATARAASAAMGREPFSFDLFVRFYGALPKGRGWTHPHDLESCYYRDPLFRLARTVEQYAALRRIVENYGEWE